MRAAGTRSEDGRDNYQAIVKRHVKNEESVEFVHAFGNSREMGGEESTENAYYLCPIKSNRSGKMGEQPRGKSLFRSAIPRGRLRKRTRKRRVQWKKLEEAREIRTSGEKVDRHVEGTMNARKLVSSPDSKVTSRISKVSLTSLASTMRH